jgi:malonyl-CoA decarboxylase
VNTPSFLRRLLGGKGDAIDRRTQLLLSLCGALLAERGEYASTALARDALIAWQGLDERCRDEFFDVLARTYSPAPEAVARATASYHADPSPEHLQELQDAVEPPRQELFRRLNMAQGGTAALVAMRGMLLKKLNNTVAQH